MKQYQSHKVVQGFLITSIDARSNGLMLVGEDDSVFVEPAYCTKHNPQVDGYYVLYPDGYESWSPAKAFEEGNTEVGLNTLVGGEIGAGAQVSTLTAETFLSIEQVASICHEANRALCIANRDDSQVFWGQAPAEQKESCIKGVTAQLEVPWALSPEESHTNWVMDKLKEGWCYGPDKDSDRKTHPCMLAYSELPVEHRVKDIVFGAIVNALREYTHGH